MTEHTPTPWIEAGPSVGRQTPLINEIVALENEDDDSGITICFMNEASLDEETNAANARRIVACVNALAGASTEDLEYCVEHGLEPMAGNLFSSRMKLQRERDELLAALKVLVDDVAGLISESRGVSGLHLNGDDAPWGELLQGGRFERLGGLQDAYELIVKAEAKA